MPKQLVKIIILLLIVGLNWAGLSAIGRTLAYFSDSEISGENLLGAGTLDFYVDSNGFSPPVTPANPTNGSIHISNEGSLDFKYEIGADNFSGALCEFLSIAAILDGEIKYFGPLDGLKAGDFDFFAPEDWNFEVSLMNNDLGLQGAVCEFDLIFKGWQTNFSDPFFGFSDKEQIRTIMKAGRWEKQEGDNEEIVLNEFLPNPFGSDGTERPNGEWVELYNLSPTLFSDLADWTLEDEAGHQLTISPCNTDTGQTTISPLGFLVVYRNGGPSCKSNFSLNNDDDTIILYNNAGHKIDSHNYIDAKAEGFSHARIPDGLGPWVDPIPTPGAPNRLESEFLKGPRNNPSENDYPVIEETFSEELNLQTDSDEISDEEEIETKENLSEQIIEKTDQEMTEEIDETDTENKNQEEKRTEILEKDETALVKEEKTDIIEETTEQTAEEQ